MDIKLFKAAASENDDADGFRRSLEARCDSVSNLLREVTSSGSKNTLLHVAAAQGNLEIVKLIIHHLESVVQVNSREDTAAHLAARAGYWEVVKVLVDKERDLLKAKNGKGNTALHEAVKSGCYTVAKNLINENPEVSLYLNNESKSPLYLAVELGEEELVSKMLEGLKGRGDLLQGKSLLYPAIMRRSRDLMDCLQRAKPTLISLKDDQGRTPIHYAASIGYDDGIDFLIKKDPSCVIGEDKQGLFPVHLAAMKGHVKALERLIKNGPDLGYMLDHHGRNILHVAAAHGKRNVVTFILRNPMLKSLINKQDLGGNTPIHSATMKWQAKIVNILASNKSVSVNIVNDDGLTALDVVESNMKTFPSIQEQLTWYALIGAGVTRTPNLPTNSSPRSDVEDKLMIEGYKDRTNTLLLVATLVATVTFAAGFTMPGGYNSNNGRALLLPKKNHPNMFCVFVFCITISLYSSITVVVTLIWSQLRDIKLLLSALKLAVPLLGLALVMMSLAFMAGIYAVVGPLTWLGIAVLVVGGVFIAALLTLFGPLCFPPSSSNPVFRCMGYFSFQLLLLLASPTNIEDNEAV